MRESIEEDYSKVIREYKFLHHFHSPFIVKCYDKFIGVNELGLELEACE